MEEENLDQFFDQFMEQKQYYSIKVPLENPNDNPEYTREVVDDKIIERHNYGNEDKGFELRIWERIEDSHILEVTSRMLEAVRNEDFTRAQELKQLRDELKDSIEIENLDE